MSNTDPRRMGTSLVVATLLVATATVQALVGLTPAGASTDTVREWNLNGVAAIMNAPSAAVPGAGQPPTVGLLHLAMVQGAVYDAVNLIVGGHEPYLDDLPAAPSSASVDAAVATAAHDVLVTVLPLVPPLTDPVRTTILARIDTLYGASLAGIPAGQSKNDGVAAGAAAAAAMIADRVGDGRYVAFSFTQGTAAGEWRPTAVPPAVLSDPFAWVGNVRPFAVESSSQFRTDGPLDMTSAQYAEEYEEVKTLGSNAVPSARTAEQTAMATFYTVNAAELFNRTFRTIAEDQGLTLAEEARLFAMLNVAGADAIINCWNDKEFWHFWRPSTAIRLGDTDGNPATVAEPTWTPLVPNPPYPDHPSGFNCITGAFMNTGKLFFGTNQIAFDVDQTALGPTRSYTRFTDVLHDTIDARIYLGIHFRTPDVQGAVLGKKVAQWVGSRFFQPLR